MGLFSLKKAEKSLKKTKKSQKHQKSLKKDPTLRSCTESLFSLVSHQVRADQTGFQVAKIIPYLGRGMHPPWESEKGARQFCLF